MVRAPEACNRSCCSVHHRLQTTELVRRDATAPILLSRCVQGNCRKSLLRALLPCLKAQSFGVLIQALAINAVFVCQDENCVNRLVCSYVRPLRAGRLLESPLQAARFVSLISYERTVSVGEGVGRAEQWMSLHALLCRARGVSRLDCLSVTQLNLASVCKNV